MDNPPNLWISDLARSVWIIWNLDAHVFDPTSPYLAALFRWGKCIESWNRENPGAEDERFWGMPWFPQRAHAQQNQWSMFKCFLFHTQINIHMRHHATHVYIYILDILGADFPGHTYIHTSIDPSPNNTMIQRPMSPGAQRASLPGAGHHLY